VVWSILPALGVGGQRLNGAVLGAVMAVARYLLENPLIEGTIAAEGDGGASSLRSLEFMPAEPFAPRSRRLMRRR
jgi:hypothetical protein